MATKADYDRLGGWAVIKNPNADIDRRKYYRNRPLEVLVFAMSRTETLSVQEALHIPDPYHRRRLFQNSKDRGMWQEALEAK